MLMYAMDATATHSSCSIINLERLVSSAQFIPHLFVVSQSPLALSNGQPNGSQDM